MARARLDRLGFLLLFGVTLPDRGSTSRLCREVDESRFAIHSWPLLSRDPSVNAKPVWTSHEESLRTRSPDFFTPNPSLVTAPWGTFVA